ncbi:sigma-70 family RNA polymerase sigma factor [Nocardioidaceae bacterium SCSIO 66511]|nr:sigma-70 family RNA polymerase sigma factor [Nocardioidaceae bacterium SCSIO 66511]
MTKFAAQPDAPSDAELISRVRAGDQGAYGDLFERHSEAARRMARQLVHGPDVDDLVSEAFTKVLVQLQRGGGPDVAFRAYLLTAIRRLHVDRTRVNKRLHVTDDLEALDQDIEFDDPATASFERGAASRAFTSLPERWQLVLWHLEVEGQKPADIAPILGMSANSVAALAYRAREGLRQAYLQSHLADTADATCRWTTEHLGAYVRKGLAKRDSARVETHLKECHRCTAVYLELTEVNSNLSGLLAPALLGLAAPGYLAAGGVKVGVLLLAPWAKLKEAGAAAQAGAAAAAVAAVVGVIAVAGAINGTDDTQSPTAESAISQPPVTDNSAPPDDSNSPPPDDSDRQESPPDDQSTDDPTQPPDDGTDEGPDNDTEQPPDDDTEPPPDDEPDEAPDTPTNVSTDVEGSDIVLTWSPAANAHGYRVYRTQSSTSVSNDARSFGAVPALNAAYQPASAYASAGRLISGTIPATSYRDTATVDGTRYTYVVTAIGANGEESAISRSVAVTFDPPPAVPANVRAQADEAGVVVRWDENTEPDFGTYEVLRDEVLVSTSTSPEFQDRSVADGTTHDYRVVAVDLAGNKSTESADVQATYNPAPGAPTGVTAQVQDGKVVIGWAAGSEPDLQAYEVFRDGTSIGRTSTPSFTDPGIVDGKTNTYTVVAIDQSGQTSQPSAAATATYDPAPSAPTGVTAQVQDGKVLVSWNAGSEPDLKTYEVYRNGTPIGRTTSPSYADSSVVDGQTYTYSVVAIDKSDQQSPRSAKANATYDPAPKAPTGLTSSVQGSSVHLDWNPSSEPDVTSYRLYRNGEVIATVSSPGYTDDHPLDDKATYSVSAVDKSGKESDRSEKTSTDLKPDAPAGFRATAVGTEVKLTWNANSESDVSSYRVYRKGEAIATVPSPHYTDANPLDGKSSYSVTAVDESGESARSDSDFADASPGKPSGFVCSVNPDETLDLTWDPPATDIRRYEVHLDWKFFTTFEPRVTDGGHGGAATHRVRIVAIDNAGNRSETAEFICKHEQPDESDARLGAETNDETGSKRDNSPNERPKRDPRNNGQHHNGQGHKPDQLTGITVR